MKRYDWERYDKPIKNVSSWKDGLKPRYRIIDRKGLGGCAVKMATVYDVADAEMICSALNEEANK